MDLESNLITCTYNGWILMSRCGRRRYIFILVKIAKVLSLLSLFKVIKVVTKALILLLVLASFVTTFQGLVY